MIPKALSFSDYIKTAEQKIISDSTVWDNYSRAIQESQYSNFLTEWFEVFALSEKNIKIIFFEDLKQDPRKVMDDLCEWLAIDKKDISDETFNPENTGGNYRFRWFRNLFLWARNNQKKLFLTNKRFNKLLKSVEQRLNKTDKKEKMNAGWNRV